MNDDLIVINAYPDTIEREIILENCINQFKKTNKEILLVSHYPIKVKIQQLVDYFIYDIRNHMLDESMLYWYGHEDIFLQAENLGMGTASYAVLLSIQNAVCLAKNLGKKIFYYFDYDCLISDKDLKKIDLLTDEIYKKGKRGWVRTNTYGIDMKNLGIHTNFFICEVDFYFENFKILQNREEYKKLCNNGITLEFYFYQSLSKNISQLNVINGVYLKEIFPTSGLNLSSIELSHFIYILPEKKSRKPVLTITNPKSELREYKILFLKNGNINEVKISVSPNGYYYNILDKEIEKVDVFYKENNNWELVYDKIPIIEVKNKKDFEYVRIN